MANFQNRFSLRSSIEKFVIPCQIETASFGVTLNTKYMYRMAISIVERKMLNIFAYFMFADTRVRNIG